MGSRWGTVTYVSAQRGELLFIMALLGQAVQTHDTVPPQGAGARYPNDGHLTFSMDEQSKVAKNWYPEY